MADLNRFRNLVTKYRKPWTQMELAEATNLTANDLSHRLGGTGKSPLRQRHVLDIVVTLAKWQALSWEEAVELLTLMDYPLDTLQWKTSLQEHFSPPDPALTPSSSIANWEAGEFKPKRDLVIRRAKALELSQQDTDALLLAARYDPSTDLERISDRVRKKYLEAIDKEDGTVKSPINISVQAIFQPLQLRHDPLLAEALYREERRLLLDETPHEKSLQQQTLSEPVDQLSSSNSEQTALVVIARNGDDALSKTPQKRMVVLGGPGTGKTTLLKYFISDRARKALNDDTAPIPIFIQLAEFARSGKSLRDYLSDLAKNLTDEDHHAHMLWTVIQAGQAFICLDGLDEVIEQRQKIINDLLRLISNEEVAWVISSRFTHYKEQELISKSFTQWELQPMDDTLQQELANRLLPEIQRLFPSKSKESPTTFIKTLKDHPKIAVWGKNPLLFTLAAVAFVKEGKLPVDRSDLYRTNIETILELHEQNPLRQSMLYRQLSALALELFLERKGRVFTFKDLRHGSK